MKKAVKKLTKEQALRAKYRKTIANLTDKLELTERMLRDTEEDEDALTEKVEGLTKKLYEASNSAIFSQKQVVLCREQLAREATNVSTLTAHVAKGLERISIVENQRLDLIKEINHMKQNTLVRRLKRFLGLEK